MGALWAVLGGTVAVVVGIIGLIKWWVYFLKGLAATLPALLIFGGAIALFIGFTEIKDSLKSKEDTDFSSFTPESTEEEKPEEKASESEEKEEKGKKASKKE